MKVNYSVISCGKLTLAAAAMVMQTTDRSVAWLWSVARGNKYPGGGKMEKISEKISILIVDDENFVCENLKLKLQRLDLPAVFSAASCNSAKQALILLSEKEYQIIFTDIRMPFTDGLSFIKQLRSEGYRGKIFALSGYDDFDYVRSAFVNGADDYILKPIAISQLREKLNASLSHDSFSPDPSSCSSENDLMSYAIQYINDHYADSSLTMSTAAAHVSISYNYFSNLFCRKTGETFPTYLLHLRVKKAAELLEDPSLKIADICYKVGFKSPQQFSRDFKKITGVYPSEFRTFKYTGKP